VVSLGRKQHSPARLTAAPWHKFGAEVPDPSLDRTLIDFKPLLGGNDVDPNCTVVSWENAARGVSFLNGALIRVDESLMPINYAGVVGCAPTQEAIQATDGAQMLDVVAWQELHGFDLGTQTRLIGRSGVTNVDMVSLALAMKKFGHSWMGVRLYDQDMQTATAPGIVWDSIPGRDPGNLVGGHAIFAWAYTGLGDEDIVYVGTWGDWKPVTWRWLRDRIDEAHALVCRQLARPDGTYLGLTADGLTAQL
jgi:hypothetical protein